MSGKSNKTNSVRSESGSLCGNSVHEKLHASASGEEKIMLAADESKDRLYEPKRDKKTVRVLTVVVYVFSVSLAAIMLSLYYVFFWEPKGPHYVKPKVSQVHLNAAELAPRTLTSTPTKCLPHSVPTSDTPITPAPPLAAVTALDFAPSDDNFDNYTSPTTDQSTLSPQDLLENETNVITKINSKRKRGRDPDRKS